MTSMMMVTGVMDILAADYQSNLRKSAERARLLSSLRGNTTRLSELRAAAGGLMIRAGRRLAGREVATNFNGQPARA
jgi:hypothetical protein